jgi:hypothetical protein
MKTYKQFISEMQANVPVVSIDKQYNNIRDTSALEELNKNLSIEVSTGFSDMRQAFNKIRKILSMYALKAGSIDDSMMDKKSGKLSIPVSYGDISGASLHNYISPGTKSLGDFTLDVDFSQENGVYNVKASVK